MHPVKGVVLMVALNTLNHWRSEGESRQTGLLIKHEYIFFANRRTKHPPAAARAWHGDGQSVSCHTTTFVGLSANDMAASIPAWSPTAMSSPLSPSPSSCSAYP